MPDYGSSPRDIELFSWELTNRLSGNVAYCDCKQYHITGWNERRQTWQLTLVDPRGSRG